MLSEGWDVKSVMHILGLRAFGSPLLTEQIVGRGLRRTNYDVLNRPLDQRPEGYEETVDAFGIPFVGFPVVQRQLLWPLGDNYFGRFRCDLDRCRECGDGLTSLWTARAPSTGS